MPFPFVIRSRWLYLALLLAPIFSCMKIQVQIPAAESLLADKVKEMWPGEAAIVLEDSLQVSFQPSSNHNTVHVREVEWILTRDASAVRELSQVNLSRSIYSTSSPSIELSWFSPENGSGYLVKAGDFMQQHVFSSDDIVYSYHLPTFRNGLIFRFAREYDLTRPEFISSFKLISEYPVFHGFLKLDFPKNGEALKYRLVGSSGFVVDSTSEDQNGTTIKQWSFASQNRWHPAGVFRAEEWVPALNVSFPYAGSKSMSWVELGDHYLAAVKDFKPKNPELFDSISSGKTPQEIFDFVRRNVRYNLDTRNDHTVFPRSADFVLEMGYGDCKEMSFLLTQLLKRAGIKAHMVLITATPGHPQPFPEFPSLGNFDHMIVAWTDEKGQRRFLDPTNDWSRWDESIWPLIDQRVLVLDSGRSEYTTLTAPPELRSEIHSTNEIAHLEIGKAQQHGSIEFIGLPSYPLHLSMAGHSKAEQSVALRHTLSHEFHLDALSAKVVTDTLGFFKLEYIAEAGNSLLPLHPAGLKLDAPSLMYGQGRSIDGPGLSHVLPITQTDEWVLPNGKYDIEHQQLDEPMGQITWLVDGNHITRKFSSAAQPKISAMALRKQLQEIYANILWIK